MYVEVIDLIIKDYYGRGVLVRPLGEYRPLIFAKRPMSKQYLADTFVGYKSHNKISYIEFVKLRRYFIPDDIATWFFI